MTTVPTHLSASSSTKFGPWLFSAPVDLATFLGSAALSLLLLAYGGYLGVLHEESPEWAWAPFILLIDVAHVYATGFRVYFDRQELTRRPALYLLTPLLCYGLGVALYSEGETLFWRVLAYFAVFHFVRQQYGWVALYRAKAKEPDGWGRWIDTAAIYAATLYPLLYWHEHLPRRFSWFMQGDFAGAPPLISQILFPVYAAILLAYALRSALAWRSGRPTLGKDIVVATTAVCWYVGIVAFNSDYAFTVTNVIIHGVPYMVLVFWYWTTKRNAAPRRPVGWLGYLALFLSLIWILAYVEELFWDRAVWGDRPWLFGESEPAPSAWKMYLVPLLATPQATHYALDGFIWRRKSNPDVGEI